MLNSQDTMIHISFKLKETYIYLRNTQTSLSQLNSLLAVNLIYPLAGIHV